MSTETYWRLLGERPRPIYPGEAVPVVDYLVHRRPGAGWNNGAVTAIDRAYRARFCASIDPPVGGFAAGDLLAVIPDPNDFKTIIAAGALGTPNAFAPGVFRVACAYSYTAGAAATACYGLTVHPRNGAVFTGPGPLPSRNLARFPFMKGLSGTAGTTRVFEQTFTVLEEWNLRIYAFNAMIDTDVAHLDIDVECIYPIDLPVGT